MQFCYVLAGLIVVDDLLEISEGFRPWYLSRL